LGYEISCTNPQDATKEFLKREFKEVLKWRKKPHNALIIPDSFVYGGIAAKVHNPNTVETA
jgi:hypothetical protein